MIIILQNIIIMVLKQVFDIDILLIMFEYFYLYVSIDEEVN